MRKVDGDRERVGCEGEVGPSAEFRAHKGTAEGGRGVEREGVEQGVEGVSERHGGRGSHVRAVGD